MLNINEKKFQNFLDFWFFFDQKDPEIQLQEIIYHCVYKHQFMHVFIQFNNIEKNLTCFQKQII
jgi:hypothetical protein